LEISTQQHGGIMLQQRFVKNMMVFK